METLIEIDGLVYFQIKTKKDKQTRLEFEVYKSSGFDGEGNPYGVALYLKGVIKWDGCSDLNFGDAEGDIHSCGKRMYDQMKDVLDAVWLKASKEIIDYDKSEAEY